MEVRPPLPPSMGVCRSSPLTIKRDLGTLR
jgi:hypothetical protein